MLRAAVALLVSISLLGCFPHNPRARTYAKLGEGAALLAGIGVAAVAGTGADCDQMAVAGQDTSGCKTRATVLSTIGVTLIVAGLLGFVATISTAEDDKEEGPKPIEIKAQPTTNTQATDAGSAAGSAAPAATPPAAGSDATAPAQGSAASP